MKIESTLPEWPFFFFLTLEACRYKTCFLIDKQECWVKEYFQKTLNKLQTQSGSSLFLCHCMAPYVSLIQLIYIPTEEPGWKLKRCWPGFAGCTGQGPENISYYQKAFFDTTLGVLGLSEVTSHQENLKVSANSFCFQPISPLFCYFFVSHVFLYINILKIFCRSLFIKIIFSRPQLFLK